MVWFTPIKIHIPNILHQLAHPGCFLKVYQCGAYLEVYPWKLQFAFISVSRMSAAETHLKLKINFSKTSYEKQQAAQWSSKRSVTTNDRYHIRDLTRHENSTSSDSSLPKPVVQLTREETEYIYTWVKRENFTKLFSPKTPSDYYYV